MQTYTIVGIYERPGFEEHSAPGYTVITKEHLVEQTDNNNFFVTLTNPQRVQGYAGHLAEEGDYVLNEDVLRFMGISDNKLFNTLRYSVGSVLIAIIMVGSIFLI